MSIELIDIILIKQHRCFVLFFIATFHKCMFIGKFASFSLSKCFWGEILSVPFSKIFPNVLRVLLCFVCLCPSGLNQKNRNLFLWQHFSRFAITSGLRMNPFFTSKNPRFVHMFAKGCCWPDSLAMFARCYLLFTFSF